MTRPADRNRTTGTRSRRAPERFDGFGRQLLAFSLVAVVSLGLAPVASAHGGHVSVNGVHLDQRYGLVPLALGIAVVAGSRYLPRVRPAYERYTLRSIFLGLSLAVFGGIWIVQFSPYEWFTAEPIVPRALYAPLLLLAGSLIALASVLVGQFRWPTRPRYAVLGALLGLWVAYPGLSAFGVYTETNPLGYLVVLALPVTLGYVLWRDARGVLGRLLADRTARRFGAAVGLLSVVFFMFSSGMLYLVPDDGVGISLADSIVAVVPVADPLVMWPAFEFWYPQVPLGGMLSVGTVLLVTIFGGLIGLNATLFAFQWKQSVTGGVSGTTAGVAGIAAPQACCCCGPALSQVAVVTLGPSAGAPIYLLFGDPSSSIGSLFFVASVAILTGTLVYAGRELPRSAPKRAAVPT